MTNSTQHNIGGMQTTISAWCDETGGWRARAYVVGASVEWLAEFGETVRELAAECMRDAMLLRTIGGTLAGDWQPPRLRVIEVSKTAGKIFSVEYVETA
jgi:hypothetical protein